MAEMRRVGEVSEVADITYAFFVDGMALTVRRWTEHAPDGPETGARIELQRLLGIVFSESFILRK